MNKFDDLIRQYPGMKFHLGADADIVQSANFERAVVKIQRGREEELNCAEKHRCDAFS